jgi:heptosyltransferase I
LQFAAPPRRVCLLRLSAIGDACHTLAVLRSLQAAWPHTHFTWILGKLEAKLFGVIPDVEFITFDKRNMCAELVRLARLLREREFDLLLHLQIALRASLIARLVRAKIKLGFDRARARELQWLFTNAQVAARSREHVLDALLGFARACGIEPGPPQWNFPLPDDVRAYAEALIPPGQATLLVSPCSSHRLRNWHAEGYAAVAAHAASRWNMRVILTGGPTPLEGDMGQAIERAASVAVVNQIGRDTLLQLLALMARSTLLITPDSGPAHMAGMVNLPVMGLYAATNPARSGPYLSRALCIDRYAEATEKFLGRSAGQLSWNTKIERPGVMELITTEAVMASLDAFMAQRLRNPLVLPP